MKHKCHTCETLIDDHDIYCLHCEDERKEKFEPLNHEPEDSDEQENE